MLMRSTRCRFVLILELVRFEPSGLLLHDVPSEIEHVLGDFDVLDVVEIFLLGAHFVGVAESGCRARAAFASMTPIKVFQPKWHIFFVDC
jgi:hypothetical protein